MTKKSKKTTNKTGNTTKKNSTKRVRKTNKTNKRSNATKKSSVKRTHKPASTMKKSTRRLCRAGVIAALYVALTYAFMPLAFGPLQVRPAEALCILPLFFPEAVPALYVGCMLANITSPFAVYDVFIGSLATLFAAFATYLVGRFCKKQKLKPFLGGIFPVLFNAFIIPVIIVFLCGGTAGYLTAVIAYFANVFTIFLTECVWVYGLGIPLYKIIKGLKKRGVAFLS